MSVEIVTLPSVSQLVDFTAGLVYGITGDNHLDELHDCMVIGDTMVTDFEKVVADVKAFHVFSAISDIGDLIWQLPGAFEHCTAIKSDLILIEDWAQIFKHPVELAETVAKNILFHGITIGEDTFNVFKDWNAGKFFEAGEDTADALTLLIGPSSTVQGLPPVGDLVDFTGGLIYGLTGDNHLTELQQCMDISEPILEDLEKLLADLKAFQVMSVLSDIGDLIWQLPIAFQGCTGIQSDIQAIEDWAKIFKQPVQLAETVAKNWIFHGVEIESDITACENDWTSGKFFDSGEDAAGALVGLLGPIKPSLDFIQ